MYLKYLFVIEEGIAGALDIKSWFSKIFREKCLERQVTTVRVQIHAIQVIFAETDMIQNKNHIPTSIPAP